VRLTGSLLNRVMDCLMPHFLLRDEREAIVRPALWGINSVYDVEFEGSARVFTLRLISTLSRDNLIAVLQETRNWVGVDKGELINKICEELEKIPSDLTYLVDLVKLRNELSRLFTKSELAELCFDIQHRVTTNGLNVLLNIEEIGADGSINSISQNLISFMQRRDLLHR
jgi:hypothetical protein